MNTKTNQTLFSFSIFLTTLAVFLFFPKQSSAKIIINEIAWMGTDESQYGEWIELYNDGAEEVDLKDWKLYKKKSDVDAFIISLTKKIDPGSYYLIERTTPSVPDPVPGMHDDAGTWKENGLSNSGETLSLKDENDNLIDLVDGSDKWKINGGAEAIGDNVKPKRTAQLVGTSWKTLAPTPKAKNENEDDSGEESEEESAEETESFSQTIRINEVLPNPIDENDEWIELFNFGEEPLSLKGWTIADKTKSYSFSDSDTVSPKGFFMLPRTKSGIALNNTSETIILSDPSKNIIHQISYQKTVEGASFNYTSKNYRWSKTITPGTENIFNNAPETKKTDIPDTAYLSITTSFSASGKDDDGEKIKYTWDFGDGHKSYLKETTHRYEKEGKYQGTITITDDIEETITPFTIEVEKYEAPKVRMTALVPNPAGKDTDAEYITIENRSRKSVDLLGWSIATGWKKLTNHPIRESFIIPKKSSRSLTREFSAFTLPNKKGKIELRSPDGKTVQKMKYNLKEKSAEENARFVKEKGKKWAFIQGTENNEQGTTNRKQRTVSNEQGEQRAQNREQEIRKEKQLQQDTETIVLKKERGEKLVSTEKNSEKEMARLISFGTDIQTPQNIIAITPRVAGANDEAPVPENSSEDPRLDFDLNALINDWLARE